MNLVGSTRPEEVAAHVSDSLAAAPWLPRGARVVDLGTGAGFPGIPILITRPDLDVVLVERREKRVHFLRQVVRVLDLACEVRRCSIEDGPAPEGRFDFVLLRAVAPAARALDWARPWTRPEGEIWLWTREPAFPDAFVEVGAIPLGERGRIARLLASPVSRGTR
jgi:16S rRNA (guanine527-N7)-methyltransferase